MTRFFGMPPGLGLATSALLGRRFENSIGAVSTTAVTPVLPVAIPNT